ncbi:SDR family oxidoreductase [uncultured Bacteroides sp.]|uniref:SDR family NAD(P)-dependent oxidoreductase n=1 Tax=uncultured Bacteroides sp. TaxID=162156 RepID=UPI0025CD229A|nr:SDR family oxidoreductase [uncultured Bacteroides sp.]
MISPFSLEGKTVLVTGSSSGIGRGIAVECSKMGARIILNGRSMQRLEETMTLLSGSGHSIIEADLSNQSEIEKLVQSIPQIDGCVFCAGIPQVCPVKHIKRGELEDIFSVNTLAPIMMTSALAKRKKITKGASLVFIESISGVYVGTRGDVSYNASKAALNGFVKGAALEFASQGIRVNAVNPGLVPTNILHLTNSMFSEEHHADIMLNSYPLKRLGKPEDIAYGVIYLLSDASGWVTGTNLVIDGGYVLN